MRGWVSDEFEDRAAASIPEDSVRVGPFEFWVARGGSAASVCDAPSVGREGRLPLVLEPGEFSLAMSFGSLRAVRAMGRFCDGTIEWTKSW